MRGTGSLWRSRIESTFGDYPIGSIRRVHIQQWISKMEDEGLSASRIRQAYRVLSQMLRLAQVEGYIVKSPAIEIGLPRMPSQERRFLTAAQVGALADAIEPRYRALIYVLGYGGLRFGEAVALRRKRVDLLGSRVIVAEAATMVGSDLTFGTPKTHRKRSVRLPGFVTDRLERHLDEYVEPGPDALVFTNTEGGPLRHDDWPRRVFKRAAKQAGLPEDLTPHEMRHTAAALLIQSGADPKAIQSHLGHKTIAVTFDTYGHLFPDHLDDVMGELEAQHERTYRPPEEGDDGIRVAS